MFYTCLPLDRNAKWQSFNTLDINKKKKSGNESKETQNEETTERFEGSERRMNRVWNVNEKKGNEYAIKSQTASNNEPKIHQNIKQINMLKTFIRLSVVLNIVDRMRVSCICMLIENV